MIWEIEKTVKKNAPFKIENVVYNFSKLQKRAKNMCIHLES